MGRMPYIQASGDAADLGRAQGLQARELVRENLRLYFRRFREEWGLPRPEVLRRAEMYKRVIEEAEPEYWEAIHSLAEAADLPLLEVVSLNARYEIIYSEYSRMGMKELGENLPAGCTSIALLPACTTQRHLLMAQNWDWIPGIRGIVQRYRPRQGPEVLAFTEAGIIGGKIGLNSAGLGLLINGLVSDKDDWRRLGVPFHVRCWQVLLSETLEEASTRIKDEPSSCSANFIVGQRREGAAEMIDLEMSPVGVAELRPLDGVLTHANHFLLEDALGIRQPLMEERTSTHQRYNRANEILAQRLHGAGRVGMEDLKSLLRDHTGHPNSICRHQEGYLPEVERYETVVSVLMDLHDRKMLISAGPPCEVEYEAFSL